MKLWSQKGELEVKCILQENKAFEKEESDTLYSMSDNQGIEVKNNDSELSVVLRMILII